LTSKKHGFEHDVKLDVEARVRQGVKAVLEEVLQDEMTQHLEAGYRELTPTRKGRALRAASALPFLALIHRSVWKWNS
jgi:transposase-like protein